MNINTNEFQCSGCRKRKVIVLNTSGMNYCDGCKHKAPSKTEFREFLFDKHSSDTMSFIDKVFDKKKSGKFRGY